MATAPNDANEQRHAELVEACKRLYPNLTDEEIEEFLRAHGPGRRTRLTATGAFPRVYGLGSYPRNQFSCSAPGMVGYDQPQ